MRVLLLGGTSEAASLARMLAGDGRFDAVLSLAGATRDPAPSAIAARVGGFGGAAGLRAWLLAQRIEALVDATHPYAVGMSRNAAIAAAEARVPLLRIARPAWTAREGDRWTHAPDAEAAAKALGPAPRRVLLTVGSRSLPPFRGRPLHRYVVRCIDAPEPSALPSGAELLLARGPFTLEDELELLATRRIEVLVTKNSGGDATAAKLEAARRGSLPVVMIARPAGMTGAGAVPGAGAAMEWLSALHRAGCPGGTAHAPDPRGA